MVKSKKILIIDDHPLIISAYEEALKIVERRLDVQLYIKHVSNIKDVNVLLNDKKYFENIDLVFLDIRLSSYNLKPNQTGEHIGLKIRVLYEDVKIVVSTAVNDNYIIHRILQGINPDGFLIKDDLTPTNLVYAIECILKECPFYSKMVLKLLRTRLLHQYNLDDIDRRILYELSIGTKLKDLTNILPLSLGGIEHRKRNLKRIFRIDKGGEHDLLQSARDNGII